eukprot:2586699-Amphidinium_carterae.1
MVPSDKAFKCQPALPKSSSFGHVSQCAPLQPAFEPDQTCASCGWLVDKWSSSLSSPLVLLGMYKLQAAKEAMRAEDLQEQADEAQSRAEEHYDQIAEYL